MWKTEHSETTTASPETVWNIVKDVERWADWNPGYREAHLDGELAPGSAGTVVLANGMKRPFSLIEASPTTSLIIGGSGPGIMQRFRHTIEPLATGGCRVSMAATMEGPLTPVFSRLFGRVMAGYYPTAVRQLVATAEGSHVPSGPHGLTGA
jgi:Polyketide cyclase / dehydrase and lipid transport